VRSWSDLAIHESKWWDLLERSEQNEPTLSPLWLGTWWKVFGDRRRRLHVLLIYDEGRLIGLAPLLSRVKWYRPGLPFRRLELIGSGEAEADEICSEYLGVVAERGREAEVVAELARALAAQQLGGWDEAVFPALRGESLTAGLLCDALKDAGLATQTTVTADCPYIALPRSWDDYLAMLPSTARHFVKRSISTFDHWSSGDAELREVRTAADLEHGSSVLRALHENRWSGAGQGGVFASPRFRAFHDEVMQALLARGALELSWLLVRGEPVAALYNFVWNGKVYFYQSGRKLDVPAAVRPGIVAHVYAIRRAIEAGRREYDFLGGASAYKLKLATATRPLLSVRAVRSSTLERARDTAERGIQVVRQVKQAARRVKHAADGARALLSRG
jgi:CelD/BcsL family acetyltransferase involved in cellulose biosynthesis